MTRYLLINATTGAYSGYVEAHNPEDAETEAAARGYAVDSRDGEEVYVL